ncbi:MAG: DUF1059 domain-containing protein [Alphaproteobacteria bacterium]
MTKVLNCIRGDADCGFSAEGESNEEVIQTIAAHLKNEHDENITPDLFARLQHDIHEK